MAVEVRVVELVRVLDGVGRRLPEKVTVPSGVAPITWLGLCV